jgi:ABC-type antimicrobial peptide transport system permease subunit
LLRDGDSCFLMLILTGFGAASLLLAAMGLYGTLAYLAAQRTREFGVRIALGASTQQIISMLMGEGVRLTAMGVAMGAVGAWAAAQLLRRFLYHVRPFDIVTIAGVAALVGLAAMISAGIPAWRASRMDPNAALRSD